jgi:ADP-ribose pyrophosphatase
MTDTMWEGRFIAVKQEGTWEYVERRGDLGAAVIVAVDGEDVILVEQFRVPAGRRCLELPAGLVGDDQAGETIVEAARRELEEETGYHAETVEDLGEFLSSPGMTSERFTIIRATGLTRIGEGGGEGDEDITVHRVALTKLPGFVRERRAAGLGIDAKLLLLLGLGGL